MIKITEKQLIEWDACKEGISWYKKHKTTGLRKLIHALLKDNHADYARWLLKHLLDSTQLIQWAIYSAELALPNFESVCPADQRPRQAIQAAKDYLAGKYTKLEVQSAAESAARSAARSAESEAWSAASAAWSAAWSAESAWSAAAWSAESAWSAARFAESAAESAAGSAELAARSAASSAGSAARSAVNKKIMNYALTLLGE